MRSSLQMSTPPYRPLHIVQVGYDDSVFATNAPSDTFQRQVEYGREIDSQQPGSRMSFVSLTSHAAAHRIVSENVTFIPIIFQRRREIHRLFSQLVNLHQEQPIDVIATQTIYEDGWVALLFSQRYGVPVIGQIHYDVFSDFAKYDVLGRRWGGRIRYRFGMWLIRRYAAIRVVGQRIKTQMLAKRLNDKVYVLPVAVTMANKSRSIRRPNTSAQRVLFVGRLVAQKNLETWLRVAALVADLNPATIFEIVGDGPLRPELEQLAQQLGIAQQVCFRGALAYDKLPEVYSSATLFLITSHYEGFGRVVVEAYLNALPVVGVHITGLEDIIEDGVTGFLHASDDLKGMAESTLKLLRDASVRQQMGEIGRSLVRTRFDPENLSRRWVDLLISTARRQRV